MLEERGTEFESLEDFLASVNISETEYDLVLKFGYKVPTVINKRRPCECWINCYNPHTLKLMESNQDVAFALSMYGCICYLLSYLAKPERNVSKLMKEAMHSENEEASKFTINHEKNLDE